MRGCTYKDNMDLERPQRMEKNVNRLIAQRSISLQPRMSLNLE